MVAPCCAFSVLSGDTEDACCLESDGNSCRVGGVERLGDLSGDKADSFCANPVRSAEGLRDMLLLFAVRLMLRARVATRVGESGVLYGCWFNPVGTYPLFIEVSILALRLPPSTTDPSAKQQSHR